MNSTTFLRSELMIIVKQGCPDNPGQEPLTNRAAELIARSPD